MKRELATASALLGGAILWAVWNSRKRVPLGMVGPVAVNPHIRETDQPIELVAPQPLIQPRSVVRPLRQSRPTDAPAFGHDSKRNEDTIGVDDYMSLPLEGSGVTHETRERYKELEADSVAEPEAFSFYRLKVLETRDPFAHYVALNGFRVVHTDKPVALQGTRCWNPHTGEHAHYSGTEPWRATEQRELILNFPQPVVIHGYQFRTAEELPAFDPVRWVLEGSRNGAHWLTLDDRSRRQLVPTEREVWATFRISSP